MAETKLSNLVNSEVMGDMISGGLTAAIKLAPLAGVDETLVGVPGNTVTVPKYSFIGEADDLTEGVAMGTVVLSATTQNITVKEAGKSVEITDQSVLSGYGDPVGEAENQLKLSIAGKVDNDLVTALSGATLTYDGSASPISYDGIVTAIDAFGEEDDEQKYLVIHPNQKSAIRKDANFINGVENSVVSGAIGEFAGCIVIASKRVPQRDTGTDGVADVYDNFILKEGALAIYLKKDTNVESQRDILKRTTVVSATKHYAAALKDESKAVKATFKI